MLNKNYSKVYFIVFTISFLVKIIFYLFFAKYYFGTSNFIIQGDTPSYLASIINLIEHGYYTTDVNSADAYASRLPGYPFFLGIFFLIFGTTNILLVSKIVVITQIIMSSITSVVVYKIINQLFSNNAYAFIVAILFSIYPFSLVWTSVLYAESISIDLLIWTYYFILFQKNNRDIVFAGILAGISVLVRPQLIFLWVVMPVYMFIKNNYSLKNSIQGSLIFILVSISMYSIWPLRNYINHDKWVFQINLTTSRFMSMDRLNFAYFMWSVKTDWEPQISQIINNKAVTIPSFVFKKLPNEDIEKLNLAIQKSKTCSDGFANLKKLPPIDSNIDCTNETAEIWKQLRKSVIQHAPLEFYVLVPLSNLQKAIFKSRLIKSYNRKDKPKTIDNFVSLLFLFRTVFILLGISGCIYILFSNNFIAAKSFAITIIITFVILYFWLCFIYRDMDMRYLLPADILLLFTALIFFEKPLRKIKIF